MARYDRHERDTKLGPSMSVMRRTGGMQKHSCDTHVLVYSARHDAITCTTCDVWLELPCEEPSCRYDCVTRPKRPSGVAEVAA